jgi:Zn-dependent peptidase ImmA (M78 family)
VNWDVAHQVAAIAAVKAHRDLGVDREEYVDVYAALRAAGVFAMARPMPRLFGMYASPRDDGPAVLLNTRLDVVAQRHTAAHELGHHRQGHGSALDEELDRTVGWGDGSWPDEEKVAEAFAAWFLMPPPAVHAALRRVGTGRPQVPGHAYQVARWLGASYAGTVNHLHRLRLISRECRAEWLRVKPADIKADLVGGPVPGRAHVHVIGAGAHGATVRADAGDLIVLTGAGAVFESLPGSLVPQGGLSGQLALGQDTAAGRAAEVTDCAAGTFPVTAVLPGAAALEFRVQRQGSRAGVQDLWPV